MQDQAVELNQLVIAALDPLRPARREEILSEIDKLFDDPANRHLVRTGIPSPILYAVDTPDGLRAFFRLDDGGRVVEMVDLYRPSTWQDPSWHAPATIR